MKFKIIEDRSNFMSEFYIEITLDDGNILKVTPAVRNELYMGVSLYKNDEILIDGDDILNVWDKEDYEELKRKYSRS